MTAVIAKGLIFVIIATGASVTLSPDLLRAVTAAFTFLNTSLLIYHSRRINRELIPKVERVERVATEALDSTVPGGRRSNDPPAQTPFTPPHGN